MKEVELNKMEYKCPVGLDEIRLPPGVKVRYLYAEGELEGGGERHRATDVREELKVVPGDTQLPPDRILK